MTNVMASPNNSQDPAHTSFEENNEPSIVDPDLPCAIITTPDGDVPLLSIFMESGLLVAADPCKTCDPTMRFVRKLHVFIFSSRSPNERG